MSAIRGIAKITDIGDHILVSCDMKSTAAITAAGGVVNGSATVDSNGAMPGLAGSVSFSNYLNNAMLTYAGQIVCKVQAKAFCQADSGALVSASRGDKRTASGYILSTTKSDGTTEGGYILAGADNSIRSRLNTTDTAASELSSTVGADDFVELCLFWDGAKFWLAKDGAVIESGARTAMVNTFYMLVFGAYKTKNTIGLGNYYIKDVVVSRKPPDLIPCPEAKSLGIFGDSYAEFMQQTSQVLPEMDTVAYFEIQRQFQKIGHSIRIGTTGGHGGYTICNTGSSDLSTVIDAFSALNFDAVAIVGGNNDMCITGTSQILNVTTGTDANYKSFIAKFVANNQALKKIIVTTTGSLFQDAALNTVNNNSNKLLVDGIIKALPAWFDATYPTRAGQLRVMDLWTLLGGDSVSNVNYLGYWDNLGNLAYGGTASPTATQDNRHPAPPGNIIVGRQLAGMLLS